MKKYFAIVSFLFWVPWATAQTNVSGFINSNTTWTLAGSPYIVVGNALLSQGFTLTINPGVVVKFDNSKALQIDGELIAIGTNSQRITFTSNQSVPQAGDWAKLHFSDFSTDAVYDAAGNYLSGTIMKYCDVLYGGALMFGAIDIQESSPYFNHCRISNSSFCGINFNGDSLTIDSSSIKNCAARGVYYQGGHFLMRNDSFIANVQGAFHLIQAYDGIQSRILDSYFASNASAITWQNNWFQYTTIKGNMFTGNTGPVIELQGRYDTLSCNKFINNTGGPAIHWGDAGNPISGGVIYNNLFQGNFNSSGPCVFDIGAGYNSGGGDTLIIAANIIRNNSSPGYMCCNFEADLFSSIPGRYLRIHDNLFTSNSGAELIRIHGAQNSNPSYNFMEMQYNSFIDPGCQYEVYNDVPYGSPNLLLDNNYWGSTSTTYVESVIYDYFDFANQSVVYYSPILMAPVVIDSLCQPFTDHSQGIDDMDWQIHFQVYPNPATDQFVVHSPQFSGGKKTFVLTNALGQEVKQVVLTNNDQVISCEELPEGVYFYRIIGETELVYSGTIVKQ